MRIDFSREEAADQLHAKRLIDAFLADPSPPRPWIEINGLAGTGKSLLLGEIAIEHPEALLMCYMNKSAYNLSMKSGLMVSTIHAGIYEFLGKHTDDFGQESLRFETAVADGAWEKTIAIIDESGTVDLDLGRDLLATGCRVIAAGDPGQLRPVKGQRFFDRPDFTLQRIHRQAWDSPIIRQAHAVRAGRDYAADGEDFRVERHIGHDDIVAADVILCWRNETRKALNLLKRAHLRLDGAPMPLAGEPVMALTNDRRMGIMNGAVYRLERDVKDWGYSGCSMSVRNERGHVVNLDEAWIEGFNEATKGRRVDKGWASGFALAYAGTVHKWLGSESNSVILVDEYNRAEERAEFLYTGMTRAQKRVVVQRAW